MLYVVGKEGCSRCQEIKEELDKSNMDYGYIDYSKESRQRKRDIVTIVREENDGKLPLVFNVIWDDESSRFSYFVIPEDELTMYIKELGK